MSLRTTLSGTRCRGYLRRLIAFQVQGLTSGMAIRLSNREQYDGFCIYVQPDDLATKALAEVVRDSLRLIQTTDRQRYRRLQHQVRHITVHPRAVTDYHSVPRVALISSRDLAAGNPVQGALILIQLGVWARILERFGARIDPLDASRIRIRGLRSQLAFLARLDRSAYTEAETYERRVRAALDRELRPSAH